MSQFYTTEVANEPTKRQSREKVANGIMQKMKDKSVIHYLGGTSTQTPFENYFKRKNTTFVRYERMRSICPSGYDQVYFDRKGNAIVDKKAKKHFINDDFFNSFFEIDKKIKGTESHFWLDFCGMPKYDLLDAIFHTFLHDDSWDFKSVYLTFFLNPRSCKEVKQFFTGNEKTLEERTTNFLNKLKEHWEWDEQQTDKTIEVFDSYHNGKSPMVVLKIERREKEEDMTKTASVENYVNLHKRGFSNKQIAIFWRAGIMQVAGYAASAKRMKMI